MAGSGLALQPWQWAVFAASYVIFFVVPAIWMARRARRDGESVFVWTVLVLVGSLMGVYEYYHHLGIQKSRAKRARRAAERAAAEAGAGATGQPSAGNAQDAPGDLPRGGEDPDEARR